MNYNINRIYTGPDVPMDAAPVGPDEIVVNIGLVAAHITPSQARELQRVLGAARLEHDIKYRVFDEVTS